jgi:hypothetical protein
MDFGIGWASVGAAVREPAKSLMLRVGVLPSVVAGVPPLALLA